MFNIGWGEVWLLLILALLILGPERLPGLIREIRSTMAALKKIVHDARDSLDEDFVKEMEDFRQPLAEFNSLRRMTPRSFITHTIFDGDDSAEQAVRSLKGEAQEAINSVKDPHLYMGKSNSPLSVSPSPASQTSISKPQIRENSGDVTREEGGSFSGNSSNNSSTQEEDASGSSWSDVT